jgi:tetratricopeptide (TPR) repeat protein
METKRDLEAKAKALIISSPKEAVKLYRDIFEAYPDDYNDWDAFYTMKALRASKSPDLKWANELASKFKNERVSNLYGWLIFDCCVKGKTRNDLLSHEKYISELPGIVSQKNQRVDDSFPCPTTIAILKLCDAHAENLFNARKINELLVGLDLNLLSSKSKTIETQERGAVELSSDLEKYFALKTKALLKLGEYEECKICCNLGLESLEKFHYNNDLWFKMRIALAEDKLGNHEKSEMLFGELLSSRAGNDKWFLYRDIADVYYEQGDFVKAWKFAVDAAFYGNEPHFLIGLYLLQARILFKLKRPLEGKILAELIAAILKEQEWNDKVEYNKLFQYYQIDRQSLRTVNEIIKNARIFWSSERYGNRGKFTGKVISIHKNGKMGRIKDQHNIIVDFHKKDLVRKMKSIETLVGATVEFYTMESFEGKNIAENITVLQQKESPKPNDPVGKIIDGTVKNVADFGIFIYLPGSPNGLLHRDNLPNNLKDTFKDFFLPGKKIKVKIEKVTEKGIRLKLIE